MINYLDSLSKTLDKPEYLLLILIGLYLVIAVIDFLVGCSIATINKVFSSRIAQLGIVRKLGTFFVMVVIIPIALLMPLESGVYALFILYLAIVITELYSVLAHLGLVKDSTKGDNMISDLFESLLSSSFNGKRK